MPQPTHILKVALPVPLRRLFDYLPPAGMCTTHIQPGSRVRVPFGNRDLIGIIVKISDSSEFNCEQLKAAIELLDQQPILDATMMRLYRWCAHYYQHSPGDTFATAIPALLRKGLHHAPQQETRYSLSTTAAEAEPGQLKRAPKQAEILSLVAKHPEGIGEHALKALSLSGSPLKTLVDKQWLIKHQVDIHPRPLPQQVLAEAPLTLNDEQSVAVQAINARHDSFASLLLDGVTGSGKTEVYLHCIEHTLKQGKAALVLIPEIGLTPQTVTRFKQRFNAPVAVLHSGLSDNERLHDWMAAAQGHSPIIIGTRSAVFTPIANLGLIIVDEEHDLSFKQQEGLRYHARDVAVMRASLADIPIVLGSATPSLESLHNVATQRYQHLPLTQRAGGALPPRVELIDIRSRPLQDGLSQPLIRLIKSHLQAGNQVLVFINRRGFSPTLMCHNCSWMANCQRCETRYTVHLQPYQLRCHHCDAQRPIPVTCPDCGHAELNTLGVGTERSEAALTSLFTDTPVLRIDRDSTRRKNALQEMIKQIHKGAPCILVGTQMLAKGHHFPHVTLVAILEADSGFFSSDFRGLERMGQLITQVGGRAGRAKKPGTVVIQTHQADHPLLSCLVQQGYAALARHLLAEREQAQLPPYQYAALLRSEAAEEQTPFELLNEARQLAEQHANNDPAVENIGPIPAIMYKRAGRYRAQLLLQCSQRKPLQLLLSQLCHQLENSKTARKVRWSIDIDPQESF